MTRASNEARYGGSVTLDGDDRPWPLSEIVEADELARLLGIKAGTIRQHLNAGTGSSWLPRPAGKVAGAWVWIRSQLDLEAIQAARVPRGRHAPRPVGADAASDGRATGSESQVTADDAGWWNAEASGAEAADAPADGSAPPVADEGGEGWWDTPGS